MYDIYKNLLHNRNRKKCIECDETCDVDVSLSQHWHIFAEVMEPQERQAWYNWKYEARFSLEFGDSDPGSERRENKRDLALSWLCPMCFISLKDVKTTLKDIRENITNLRQQIVAAGRDGPRMRVLVRSLARSLTYRSTISTVVTEKTSMRWSRVMAILRTELMQLVRQFIKGDYNPSINPSREKALMCFLKKKVFFCKYMHEIPLIH